MSNIFRRMFSRTPVAVEVPTDDRQQLEGLETWCVQWMSRCGDFPESPHLSKCKSVVQAFTNERDAIEFENALLDAFGLVRDTITPESIRRFKM